MLYWFRWMYVILTAVAMILYLPKLFGFRFAFKKVVHPQAKIKRKIAIVVPARDESAIIGDLFASIEKQDYDKKYFDVNVIVKDPDDPTIEIARAMGANVFVVPKQTCKGDALDGYFKSLSPEQLKSYEAFVIVDADGVLDPSYVRELNNALECDYDIYLSRKYAKNMLGGKQNRSVFSNCSALTWPILDDLGNLYRMQQNVPLNLCGQGMMLRRRIIEELGGWPYRTLTEDYELRLDSMLRGFTSMFFPYAVLYTDEAIGHRENSHRRMRWLTGYNQCDKKYRSDIKKQAKARGKYNAGELDYFFGLFPPILFLAATIGTMLCGMALTICYLITGAPQAFAAFVQLVACPFILTYVLLFAYSILAMCACGDIFKTLEPSERALMLLYNPFYLLEYVPLFLRSWWAVVRNKPAAWKETERTEYDHLNDL